MEQKFDNKTKYILLDRIDINNDKLKIKHLPIIVDKSCITGIQYSIKNTPEFSHYNEIKKIIGNKIIYYVYLKNEPLEFYFLSDKTLDELINILED